MFYLNTDQLKSWLKESNFIGIADSAHFILNDADFDRHHAELIHQHPELTELDRRDRAAFRCLTSGQNFIQNQSRLEADQKIQTAIQQNTQLLALQLDRHREQREHEARLYVDLTRTIQTGYNDANSKLDALTNRTAGTLDQHTTHVDSIIRQHHRVMEVNITGLHNEHDALMKGLESLGRHNLLLRKVVVIGFVLIFLLVCADIAFGQTIVQPARAVTTAPNYTDNQTAPLRINTDGALVVDTSGTAGTLPTGAATSANQTSGGQKTQVVDPAGDTALVTAGGLLQVDGSGVTQPISAASLPLPTGASTLAEQQSQTTALQLIDNAVSGSGFNITQFGGNNVVTGTGASGSGIPRVTLANDSSLAANQSVNVNQVGGTAVVPNRCQREEPTYVSINQTGNTQLITGTASERIYICSFRVVTATAQNVALVSGTGSTCGTSTSGVDGFGGATAATGFNFSANSGIAMGNGLGALGRTDTDADNVCLFQSGSGQLSGGLSYVSN